MGNNVMAKSGRVEIHKENIERAEMSPQKCDFVFVLVLVVGFLFCFGLVWFVGFSFLFLLIIIHVDCGPVTGPKISISQPFDTYIGSYSLV